MNHMRHLKPGQSPGEEHPAAKLTEVVAIEILSRLSSGETQKNLSEEFGVSESCISRLATGSNWAHLKRPPIPSRRGSRMPSSKLKEDDIPTIRKRIGRGESIASVARLYGVSRTTIAKVWYKRTWTHVDGPQKRRRAVYEDIY